MLVGVGLNSLPRSHLLGLLCCWEAGSVRPARVEEPIDEAQNSSGFLSYSVQTLHSQPLDQGSVAPNISATSVSKSGAAPC